MSSAAAWLLCKLCSTTTSGECRINEEAHRLGEPEGRTRKVYESGTCAPLTKSLLPTRACLNQRRALVPCVGQTISTNEWQQQSGGMILRRGSVVAAFLLCFLAKVRGLVLFSAENKRERSLSSGRLDVLCFLHACRLWKFTAMLTLHVGMPLQEKSQQLACCVRKN